MSWQEIWPSWEPLPGSESPDRDGGMSQLSAYEAGLTDDPGSWVVSGSPRDLGVSVRPVNLLGVRVTARALLNPAEHQRRSVVGLGAVTDPALLGRLLVLPARCPRRAAAVWAETSAAATGIVDRDADGCTVTRLLESPLVVDDVIVPASRGQELRAVQDASLFASFTRRWAQAQGPAMPDTAILEAKLCGVGLLSSDGRVLLSAEPPTSTSADRWTWLLAEKIYRRWLSPRHPLSG